MMILLQAPVPVSEWGLVHWVILSLAVAGLIFVVLWLTWLGRRWRWPAGRRYDMQYQGYLVHVIVPEDIVAGGESLALTCAWAVACTAQGWRDADSKLGNPDKKLREVAVWFAPASSFEKNDYLKNAAAYLHRVARSVGAEMPCAVIRDDTRYMEEVALTGEPVIHEMLHCLAGQYTDWAADREHADPRIWRAVGKERSAQHRARVLYKVLAAADQVSRVSRIQGHA